MVPVLTDPDTVLALYLALKTFIERTTQRLEFLSEFVEAPSDNYPPIRYCKYFQFFHILTVSLHNLYRTGVRDKLLVDAKFIEHEELSFQKQFGRSVTVKDLLATKGKSKFRVWREHLKCNGIDTIAEEQYYNLYPLEMCSIEYLKTCVEATKSLRKLQYQNKMILSEQSLAELDDKFNSFCRERLEIPPAQGYSRSTMRLKQDLYREFPHVNIVLNNGLLYRSIGYCTGINHVGTGYKLPMFDMQPMVFQNCFTNLLASINKASIDDEPTTKGDTISDAINGQASANVTASKISRTVPAATNVVAVSQHTAIYTSTTSEDSDIEYEEADEDSEGEEDDTTCMNQLCELMHKFVDNNDKESRYHVRNSLNLLAQYVATKPPSISLYHMFLTIRKCLCMINQHIFRSMHYRYLILSI